MFHHRDIEQLTENGEIGWSTLYDRFIKEINNLLGPATDRSLKSTIGTINNLGNHLFYKLTIYVTTNKSNSFKLM
jgi:hypothetical protein